MKRTFKSLLALAGLALIGLGSLLTASPAGAAVVTCALIDTGSTVWPKGDFSKSCTNVTTAKANEMLSGLNALSSAPDAFGKITTRFYVFDNVADLKQSFATTIAVDIPGIQPPPQWPADTVPAFTATGSVTGTPQYTVIFQRVKDSNGALFTVQKLNNISAHEAGHSFDFIYRAKAGGATNLRASDSPAFKQFIERDWKAFNLLAPCGAGGVFTGYQDSAGVAFCSGNALTGVYAGLSNRQVIDSAFGQTLTGPKEIFSEENAVLANQLDTGAGITKSLDQYLSGTRFSCSKEFTKALVRTGALPTIANLKAAGCYVAPFVPAGCTLVDKGAGFPYPYRTTEVQYVFCGTNNTNKVSAGDIFMNMPSTVASSQWRNKFEVSNTTLYVFDSSQQAVALLGSSIPASVDTAGVLGYTKETAPTSGPATTRYVAVFEKVKQPNGTYVAVDTTKVFKSAVYFYMGKMIDYDSGTRSYNLGIETGFTRQSGSAKYIAAYNQDLAKFNALARCTAFPQPTAVCNNGVPNNGYQTVPPTNFTVLTSLTVDGHTARWGEIFTDTLSPGEYRELYGENLALYKLGQSSGTDPNTAGNPPHIGYSPYVVTFGLCTRIYERFNYDSATLPDSATLTNNNCP